MTDATGVHTYTYDAANRLVLSKVEGLTSVDGVAYTWDDDGDPLHTPRGCPAQAWSVAEVLRAWLALREWPRNQRGVCVGRQTPFVML